MGRHGHVLANSARRLEVVRNCITYIFDNKMLEAKKVRDKDTSISVLGHFGMIKVLTIYS